MGLSRIKIIILSIGLISIISQKSNHEKNFIDLRDTSHTPSEKFKVEELIEDNTISKIKLSIFYEIKDNAIIYTSAKTDKYGLTGGTELEIHSIALNTSDRSNHFNYRLSASKKWKILGIRIYSESIDYDGEFTIKG